MIINFDNYDRFNNEPLFVIISDITNPTIGFDLNFGFDLDDVEPNDKLVITDGFNHWGFGLAKMIRIDNNKYINAPIKPNSSHYQFCYRDIVDVSGHKNLINECRQAISEWVNKHS